ncbi:MAG: hypothetical protein ACRDRL_01600 [Sciscionella sp.]
MTCTSATGLAPGQHAVLLFSIVATANAADGSVITASVGSGSLTPVTVRVTVRVAQPRRTDDLSLTVRQVPTWTPIPELRIRTTNTGTSTKPLVVRLDHPSLLARSRAFDCVRTGLLRGTTTCTSSRAVSPGRSLRLDLAVLPVTEAALPWWDDLGGTLHQRVTVDATLGSAERSATITLRWWLICLPHLGSGHLHPSTSPAAPSTGSVPTNPAPPTTGAPTEGGSPAHPRGSRTPAPATTTAPSNTPTPDPTPAPTPPANPPKDIAPHHHGPTVRSEPA